MFYSGVSRSIAACALAAVIVAPSTLGRGQTGERGVNEAKDGSVGKDSRAAAKSGMRSPRDDAAVRARANKLHHDSIVIGTHNDITSPMVDKSFDIGTRG